MLWNSGELPTDWTVKKLKGPHPSQPYNPDIANAFFRAGMIEAWGRGIERMITACKNAGINRPQFRYEGSGLWTQFTYSPQIDQASTTMTYAITPPVTPPVAALLKLLQNTGPLGNAAIRNHFKLKDRRHLREHYIDPALGANLIEPTLPDKPTSRLQQYKLTSKALALLNKDI
ncbi:MAG: hypothetical protein JW841_04130 [Deltaproteobacteria bacterium]|nr:hypothetical protein [Deltaproteobacteria bacterium]